jgi:hypothetical protein
MFSVEIFYDFFKSKYGWDKTHVMPWAPKVHGCKDLRNWHRWHNFERDPNDIPAQIYARYDIHGCVILYDQEPFWKNLLDIYREKRNNELNDEFVVLDSCENFLRFWPTCSWPVFCHSEKNSEDIQWIKDIGLIDCHYFYHGLIARDWFRHWKHHPDLYPRTEYEKRFLLYVRDTGGKRQYRKKVLNELFPYSDHILHNWGEENVATSDYSAKIVVQDAQKTGIHIVAETVFDDKKIHLTEKVFKPIVMCQPFILYAGPGSLEYLRYYGFRTFSDIWDESYDLESDHDVRGAMIAKLIKSLCELNDEKFLKILQKCAAIVEYNRRHFYSDEFENIMLNEMDTNILSAYEQQRQLSVVDPGGSYFYMLDRIIKKGVQFNETTVKSWRVNNVKIRYQSLCSELQNNYPLRWQQISSKYTWVNTIF